MKLLFCKARKAGAVLMPTLIIALLVGISVGSLMVLAKHQNNLTMRSMTWNSEVPIAEAGVEEAMSHINTRFKNLQTNGWKLNGNKYIKSVPFGEGYYTTTITTSSTPHTITSLGFARIPLQSNFTFRTVVAMARLGPPGWGFVGKKSVSMNGNAFVDSYDSSHPDYSSNGLYTASKRRDRAGVATTSSLKPAITTGNALVYGSAATAPGGTATGNVGDGTWLASSSGIQPGHFSDDFNMAIPDVALPSLSPTLVPLASQLIGGILYNWVLPPGDYVFPSVNLSSGAGILIQGDVRIYIKGDLTMSGTAGVNVANNAKLEIYVGGAINLTGQSIVNTSKIPRNCSIYGLPTCTSVFMAGTTECYAAIYAPNASIVITGDADFFGSVVGDTLNFSGTADLHYDEALNDGNPDYRVIAWEEL